MRGRPRRPPRGSESPGRVAPSLARQSSADRRSGPVGRNRSGLKAVLPTAAWVSLMNEASPVRPSLARRKRRSGWPGWSSSDGRPPAIAIRATIPRSFMPRSAPRSSVSMRHAQGCASCGGVSAVAGRQHEIETVARALGPAVPAVRPNNLGRRRWAPALLSAQLPDLRSPGSRGR